MAWTVGPAWPQPHQAWSLSLGLSTQPCQTPTFYLTLDLWLLSPGGVWGKGGETPESSLSWGPPVGATGGEAAMVMGSRASHEAPPKPWSEPLWFSLWVCAAWGTGLAVGAAA